MERRINTFGLPSGLLTALAAGLCIASGSLALAQGDPAPPPPRMGGPGIGPGGGPGGPGARASEGEPISDKELAERMRGRADEVEHLARALRDAAAKVEGGGEGRLEAFRMVEEAHRPLRGDWLERLGGRRMGDRFGDRMGEHGREGRDGRAGDGRRDGEGRTGEGRGPNGNRVLTDAERESMMEFAREKLPRMAQRIDQLRETDPETADRIMLRLAPRVREVLATRDADLAALRLEDLQAGAVVLDQVRVLREAMKGEDAAATESAKSELKVALEAQFDAKMKLQQHEVTLLNKRIDALRVDIESRQAAKDEFIAKLVERMSSSEPDAMAPDGPEGMMGGPGRGPDGRGPEVRRGGQPGAGRGEGQGPRGEGAGQGRPRNEPPQP
jgi:hypothetical protein